MKPFQLPLFTAAIFLLITIGCSKPMPGIWKNEKISSNMREKFHGYNKQFFKHIKENDFRELEYMLARDYPDDYDFKRAVERIDRDMQTTDFKLFDEYYIVNNGKGSGVIHNNDRNTENYGQGYNSTTPETYIALFTATKGRDRNMITTLYRKYDYGWKLAFLEISPYMVNGKTAPALYMEANAQLQQGYIIDAINTMQLATTCLRPNMLIKYDAEPAANKLYDSVLNMANRKYTYPIAVSQLPSHPRIIRIFNTKTADGYYPSIYYQSSIKLSDKAALKAENEKVQKAIGQVFPGIDKDKKYIYYSIFNELPNPKTSVAHVDLTEKIN